MFASKDSNHKKIVALASYFYQRNFWHEKSIWRMLLKQYLVENDSFPLKYDITHNPTLESLSEFEKTMWKYTERIIPTREVLEMLETNNFENAIPLNFKSGLVEVSIWIRKIK